MNPEKRRALGRGLESLLPPRSAAAAVAVMPEVAPLPPAVPAGETVVVHQVRVEDIEHNPYQTRSTVDEAALKELVESVRSSGVVQPVVVRRIAGGNRYQLIAGQRRWQASIRAGKSTVPAIVRQVSDEQAMEMTIIENLQRQDLNPMEQAHAFERFGREFGLTQEQMAQRTGAERSTVANYLRLLKLPLEAQQMVGSGQLSFSHAKLLMSLDSPEAILKFAQRAVEDGLSVRALEEMLFQLRNPAEKPPREPAYIDPNVRAAQRELERALGLRVSIRDRKGKGRIVIEYTSLEDFDRVLEMLGGKSRN